MIRYDTFFIDMSLLVLVDYIAGDHLFHILLVSNSIDYRYFIQFRVRNLKRIREKPITDKADNFH